MQIKFNRGHLIERGEVTSPVSGIALSGRVLDFLGAIRGVGRATTRGTDAGMCGKGSTDLIPVGSHGVYLLSEAVVGPA